ncbi:MAG: SDR family oxidoreductase [Pseudomonadota bacterium]
MRLKGKHALVLGAATKDNMGQVVARFFANEGAKVTVVGRHQDVLDAFAADIGGAAVVADITDKSSMDAMVSSAAAANGPIHVGMNCTGNGLLAPLLETTEEQLNMISDLQFKGVYYFLQALCAHMMEHGEGGSIIQTSSATTECVIDSHAAYIATKDAGDSLVRCFANEFGQHGIKINSVVPGLTATPMAAAAVATPGVEAAFEKEYPLGRIGTADDIAHAAVYLASDESFLTGQKVQTNGGLTLRRNPTSAEMQASIAAAMAEAAG